LFEFCFGTLCEFPLFLLASLLAQLAQRKKHRRAVREAEAAFIRGEGGSVAELLGLIEPYGPPLGKNDDFYGRLASSLGEGHPLAGATGADDVQRVIESRAQALSEGEVYARPPRRKALGHFARVLFAAYDAR
jgi:hypothetical protein